MANSIRPMRLVKKPTKLSDGRPTLVGCALFQYISLDCAHAVGVLNPKVSVSFKCLNCRVLTKGLFHSAFQEANSFTIPFESQIFLDNLEGISIVGGPRAKDLSD